MCQMPQTWLHYIMTSCATPINYLLMNGCSADHLLNQFQKCVLAVGILHAPSASREMAATWPSIRFVWSSAGRFCILTIVEFMSSFAFSMYEMLSQKMTTTNRWWQWPRQGDAWRWWTNVCCIGLFQTESIYFKYTVVYTHPSCT